MLPQFNRICVIDFEFVADPGERPKPVCLVIHEIKSSKTYKIWLEGQAPSFKPFFPFRGEDLFVAYYSSAEWGCYLALNWLLPVNVVDLFAKFRVLTNGLPGISNSLFGACQRFGINTISTSEKENTRVRILQGSPFTEEEKTEILDYCDSDVL